MSAELIGCCGCFKQSMEAVPVCLGLDLHMWDAKISDSRLSAGRGLGPETRTVRPHRGKDPWKAQPMTGREPDGAR